MTAVRAARLSTSVFLEESGDIGAHNRADAEMAENRQDGALEIARDRRPGGRYPPGRVPFHLPGGGRLEGWAGSRKPKGFAAPLPAGDERTAGARAECGTPAFKAPGLPSVTRCGLPSRR